MTIRLIQKKVSLYHLFCLWFTLSLKRYFKYNLTFCIFILIFFNKTNDQILWLKNQQWDHVGNRVSIIFNCFAHVAPCGNLVELLVLNKDGERREREEKGIQNYLNLILNRMSWHLSVQHPSLDAICIHKISRSMYLYNEIRLFVWLVASGWC